MNEKRRVLRIITPLTPLFENHIKALNQLLSFLHASVFMAAFRKYFEQLRYLDRSENTVAFLPYSSLPLHSPRSTEHVEQADTTNKTKISIDSRQPVSPDSQPTQAVNAPTSRRISEMRKEKRVENNHIFPAVLPLVSNVPQSPSQREHQSPEDLDGHASEESSAMASDTHAGRSHAIEKTKISIKRVQPAQVDSNVVEQKWQFTDSPNVYTNQESSEGTSESPHRSAEHAGQLHGQAHASSKIKISIRPNQPASLASNLLQRMNISIPQRTPEVREREWTEANTQREHQSPDRGDEYIKKEPPQIPLNGLALFKETKTTLHFLQRSVEGREIPVRRENFGKGHTHVLQENEPGSEILSRQTPLGLGVGTTYFTSFRMLMKHREQDGGVNIEHNAGQAETSSFRGAGIGLRSDMQQTKRSSPLEDLHLDNQIGWRESKVQNRDEISQIIHNTFSETRSADSLENKGVTRLNFKEELHRVLVDEARKMGIDI